MVQHFGAYETLPEDVTLKIWDKGSCNGGDSVFFEVTYLPLDFKTVYPNGIKCGQSVSAEVSIDGP